MPDIPALPARRSLSGHDAYCHVCWSAVYLLWIDKNDDPAGRCIHGCARATDCEEAMSRARLRAALAKWKGSR